MGAVRRSGSAVIIEDIVFPVEHLAEATLELTRLFRRHAYDDAIVFGHAKDGNLHFVIAQSFNDRAAIEQYRRLMDDVVELVVRRYDGALKGEHGTGRNMAPFVETEWGPDAYRIMKRIKTLADPENLLNPGVLINADPLAHVRDLKAMPSVEEEVDKCMECGFCESKCPSRDITLTPRQRIVVRRQIVRLREGSDADRRAAAALEADFPYMALDTCAADGLCATACPVSIDTGSLTKRFRRLAHSSAAQNRAAFVARHFGLVERAARIALRAGHFAEAMVGPDVLHRITGLWSRGMPHAAPAPPSTERAGAKAVYYPSCVSRIMGRLPGEQSERPLMSVLVAVAERAGVPLWIPPQASGTCCGVPFSSKGYEEAHHVSVNRLIERFWNWSNAGELPIVIDTSPCTYGLLTARPYLSAENQKKFDKLHICDSVVFAHDRLMARLNITRRAESVALHPVCSLIKLNLTGKLEAIARACAAKVTIPRNAGCCGFAGDRGFSFPELTEAATRMEAAEIRAASFDGYYSSSRTCETGMTRATGQVYRSVIHLLEEATRD